MCVIDEGVMATCFVIQPFDNGKFDKRYRDCIEPAITAAGLIPYRVDQDLQADSLPNAIERRIRIAELCVADITLDNPNVWLEVGLAIASDRPLIMICAEDRSSLPFDVRHRNVLFYKTESGSDFDELKDTLGKRINALLRAERRPAQGTSSKRRARVREQLEANW